MNTSTQMNGSLKYQLNRDDLKAILKGALLAAGGAVMAYLSSDVLPNLDESTTAGAVLAGFGATLLNLVRKIISDNSSL